MAGPFVGLHHDALIIAGGANFPNQPRWESDKVWHDRIHVLVKGSDGFEWKIGGTLPRAMAYGAAVSTPNGVLCMGGNDGTSTFSEVFLLGWESGSQSVTREPYPPLPTACAYGQATLVGDRVYYAGGQSGNALESAMANFWILDLSQRGEGDFKWQELAPWPGPSRAFNLVAWRHNGYDDCVYVLSGRRQEGDTTEFLKDVWEFNTQQQTWRRRSDAPRSLMAGTAIGFGQSHVFALGGADESALR